MEEQSLKCTYDEFYKLRNAIYSASDTELIIQTKRLSDINYISPHNVVGNLLIYRKEIADKYVNFNNTEEEKNTLIEMFKYVNKQIIDTLGLNY
jgi:hypothetical protein